jgi:tetratricopeptide (TPR) repeat protein
VAAAKMGNHEDALGYYNQALERNPEFALTYISRAISHRNLNDPEAAIVDSKKAAELFKTQGNEQGVEFAEGLVLALEQSMQPPSQRGDLLMAWLT